MIDKPNGSDLDLDVTVMYSISSHDQFTFDLRKQQPSKATGSSSVKGRQQG